jgi:hypothetical protein
MFNSGKPAKWRSTGWPIAAVMMVAVLVVGLPIAYLVIRAANAPGRLVDSLSRAIADAARTKVTVNELVLTSVTNLHKENKLVVMTSEISADVTREEGSSSWGMYWGTNVARVAVKNARVQYVVDCGKMQTSDFIYREQEKTLAVTLPRPHVDTSMVAIDPAQVMTLDLRGGWARFDKTDTRDRALAELRPKIILQASAPYLREIAETRGIEAMTKFLQPMADSLLRDGITVRIAYRD